jgi:transposase InsO family protein
VGLSLAGIKMEKGTTRAPFSIFVILRGLKSNQFLEDLRKISTLREFYQLLSYTDDVDLNKKLEKWEQFYNFNRPHAAFKGKTPYEALKCALT